jgi:hypothetical protein
MVGDSRWKISVWLAAAASVSLLVIPALQPACEGLVLTAMGGAVPMRCHFSYRVELAIGVVSLLVALSLFLVSGREARRWGGFFLFLLGGLAAFVPQSRIIGTCGVGTCHTGGIWFGIVGVLLALVGLVAAWRASARPKPLTQADV